MARRAYETNGHQTHEHEKPLPELVKDLSRELSTLMRQELELAKAELSEKGKRAGVGASMFGAAGVLGMLALGAFTACVIIALAEVMPAALAALIVAIAYGVAAGVFAMNGKSKIAEVAPPAPERTIASVKEDVQWIRGQRP